MKRPFSYSSLTTFKQCPRSFKLHYLDGIKKPFESIESFLGKRVHETLEFLYEQVMKKKPPLFDGLIKDFHERWVNKWHDGLVFVNKNLKKKDYYDLGLDSLSWYFREYKPFNQPAVDLEIKLLFNLNDDANYQFVGIADRIDYCGDGEWEIHDYKTSKRPMTIAGANKDRQLALYQIGLKKKYENVKKVKLVWHFVRCGISVESSRTEKELEKMQSIVMTEIDTIKNTIDNDGPFPPKPTPLCNWYYFWEECPTKSGNNPFVERLTPM